MDILTSKSRGSWVKLEGAAVVSSCKKEVEVELYCKWMNDADVYPNGGVVPATRMVERGCDTEENKEVRE